MNTLFFARLTTSQQKHRLDGGKIQFEEIIIIDSSRCNRAIGLHSKQFKTNEYNKNQRRHFNRLSY